MRSLTALDFDRSMHLFRMDLHRLFHGNCLLYTSDAADE